MDTSYIFINLRQMVCIGFAKTGFLAEIPVFPGTSVLVNENRNQALNILFWFLKIKCVQSLPLPLLS